MNPGWQQRAEAGSPGMLRLFARTALLVGPRVARVALPFISFYFLLVRRDERQASRAFLARVLPHPVRWYHCYRHIYRFSQVILDRVFFLASSGRGIQLAAEGQEQLHAILDAGQGVILMGSHLGSFEASRAAKMKRPDYRLRIVMDRLHNPAATEFLEMLNPALAADVLDIHGHPGRILELNRALAEGAMVALLGDRVRGQEPSIRVPFMGGEADFPTAPWQIAMVTGAPVVLFWGLHLGAGRYRLLFERLSLPETSSRTRRRELLEQSIAAYARRLESLARQYPYNWFNFYDFWQASS